MRACPDTMAVNISAMEFRDEKFLEGVFAILKETGLDPRCLELELTESVLDEARRIRRIVLQDTASARACKWRSTTSAPGTPA